MMGCRLHSSAVTPAVVITSAASKIGMWVRAGACTPEGSHRHCGVQAQSLLDHTLQHGQLAQVCDVIVYTSNVDNVCMMATCSSLHV